MKTEFITAIEYAGLTETESKMYASLLEIKQGTMTDVCKKASIKRSSGYNSIYKLEMYGLVSKIKIKEITYYSAIHPRRLLQIANLRQKQIEETLPKMIGAFYGNGEKPQVQMFEGIQAVKDVYKEAFERLKIGEELRIFSNIGRVIELFPEIPAEFKKIIGSIVFKSKVKELVYGDDAGIKYAEDIRLKSKKGYELRVSKKETPFGDNELFIFEDKIIYFSLQNNIFVVVIENKDLARTQTAMFDMAWEIAIL